MSSTTTPSRVGALDAYYTPDDCASACVAKLGNLRGRSAWEPHAGGGAFVRALIASGAQTHYSDVDPAAPVYTDAAIQPCASGFEARDALHGWPWEMRPPPAWIVGNPPFNDAEAHVRMALDVAQYGVAFLLRLAFLEGAKRRPFWTEHPAAEVHVLVNRPSFTGGATDSAAYGWFVWRRGVSDTRMRHLDWRAA